MLATYFGPLHSLNKVTWFFAFFSQDSPSSVLESLESTMLISQAGLFGFVDALKKRCQLW